MNHGMVGKKHWVIVFSMDDPEKHSVQAVHDDSEQALGWAMAVFDLSHEERQAMQCFTQHAEPVKC